MPQRDDEFRIGIDRRVFPRSAELAALAEIWHERLFEHRAQKPRFPVAAAGDPPVDITGNQPIAIPRERGVFAFRGEAARHRKQFGQRADLLRVTGIGVVAVQRYPAVLLLHGEKIAHAVFRKGAVFPAIARKREG